jgi:hypothetical protein
MSGGRRQLHVWVTEIDHAFLTKLARSRDESVGVLVRRLIRSARNSLVPHRPADSSTSTPDSHVQVGGSISAENHIRDAR